MAEPTDIGSPVKDFVSILFKQLEEGLNERGLILCKENECFAKMELNAVAIGETKAGGGVRILNFGGGIEGSKSQSDSQKITIFVKGIRKSDLEKENAEVEEARARIAIAQGQAIRAKSFQSLTKEL